MAANQTMGQIIPDIMLGLKVASREFVGLIQACNTSTGAEKAAIGETIDIPVGTAGDIIDTPVGFGNVTEGNSDGHTQQMQITNSKTVTIDWNGETEKGVRNSGFYGSVLAQQFADAYRKLVNHIEGVARTEIIKGASRAYGTAGTTPFGTVNNMSDFANVRRILNDNGAPRDGRTLVLSPEAESSLLSNEMQMIKVNESGSDATMKQGIIMPTYGFNVRSSFALSDEWKTDPATGYLVNMPEGAKKGATEIAIDTGSGSIKAGDIITFAGDTDNKYVAGEGCTTTKLVLNAPGLRADIANDAAITVGESYTPSVAMTRGAVALALRPPASPSQGDSAIGVYYAQDPITGITFEIRMYAGQRCIQFQVSIAYGCKAVNGEHIALLLG